MASSNWLDKGLVSINQSEQGTKYIAAFSFIALGEGLGGVDKPEPLPLPPPWAFSPDVSERFMPKKCVIILKAQASQRQNMAG